jgi:DNA-binding transcriptional LysR family regulator
VGLVQAGLGVAVLPALALRHARAVGVQAIPLVEPVIERAIVALHAPHHPPTAEARDFLAMLELAARPAQATPAAARRPRR